MLRYLLYASQENYTGSSFRLEKYLNLKLLSTDTQLSFKQKHNNDLQL